MTWKTIVTSLGAILVVALGPTVAAAADELSEHLEPFRPYLGKTWKGELTDPTSEEPKIDVRRFERALSGQAVRILHSINDGEYGGETIVVWDAAKESLVYYYFTTAGFYTTGTFEHEDGKFISREIVTGSAEGVSEVKGISEILPDGRLQIRAQYLKNGEWVEGHELVYVENSTAKVVYK